MKYFICNPETNSPLTGISLLAIPSEKIEKIYASQREMKEITEEEDGEVFFSIPLLLKLKNNLPSHALKIKKNILKENLVLLCPKVDLEIDIPDENIHPLPYTMSKMNFFSNACFLENKLYLILEIEKLLEHKL